MNRTLMYGLFGLSAAAMSWVVAPAQATGEATARVVVEVRLDEPDTEEVEKRVAVPLEDVLQQLPGLQKTKSTITHHLCRLELAFEGGATEQHRALVRAEVVAELARRKIEPRALSIELGPTSPL